MLFALEALFDLRLPVSILLIVGRGRRRRLAGKREMHKLRGRKILSVVASAVLILGGITVAVAPPALADIGETTGGSANTWTNYTNAGGTQGPTIPAYATVQIACKLQGFRVADGNTWWYRIAQSPWNYAYYVSADPFYNNGQTSGSLHGTPFVDPNVPDCGSGGGVTETAGGSANTWTNYTNAGGTQGPTIGGGSQVAIACKVQGFRVADGNTWWYRVASAPWNNGFYVSADAFYNNGQTSGSLRGTPFVDPAVPDCSTAPPPVSGNGETTGGAANTWSDYTNAGGTQGPTIPAYNTVTIACKLSGFRVADGNTWWYRIASSPWNSSYYVSADAFYNNGQSSGSLRGTPFVDPSVPTCSTTGGTPRPGGETAGGNANTWSNYYNAGGTQGPTIGGGSTIQVTCRVNGFRVQNGNTWWYQIASSPWNDVFYVSADAFYNNGQTSGPLAGTPFVDPAVPVCTYNREASAPGTAYGRAAASAYRPCIAADPVNCATGDFWETFTDLKISGRGPSLNLERTYNSSTAPTTSGLFGAGWSSTWDQHLSIGVDGSAAVTLADGSQLIAQPDGNGGFTVPAWANSTLARNSDGSFRFGLHTATIMTFDSTGRLATIADRNGYTTTLSYDASGHLASVTDASGRTVSVTTDGNGLLTSITDPAGAVTAYTFDTSGNLATVTDPINRTTTFGYDGAHRMTTVTDPRGGVVTNAYDAATGRVTSQTDAVGRTTTWAYTGDNFSSAGGTTTVTDPHGSVDLHQYANGYLMTLTKGLGSSMQGTWTYAYDPATNGITAETDPNGNVTHRTFDGNGQVLTVTTPAGRTTTTTYNSFNEPLTVTDPGGAVTTRTYDSAGNPLTVASPMGATTTIAYGDSAHPGDPTLTTDPDGRTTSRTFDTVGNLVTVTRNPSPGQTTTTAFAYDADGRLICTAPPNATAAGRSCAAPGAPATTGTTTNTYDPAGQQLTATDALGHTTTSSYDAAGNHISTTDPAGNVTTTTYDLANRATGVTIGAGTTLAATTTTTYDVAAGAGGCPTTAGTRYCAVITDPVGKPTVHGFDARDNEVVQTLPGAITSTWTYDLLGRRTSLVDAAGRTTGYGYDADGNTTLTTYSDGTTPNASWTYDTDGRRATMTDGTGITTYSYDADSRTTSVVDGAGLTVGYGYDHAGDVTSVMYPNGQNIARTFDGAGRLTTVTDWGGRTTTFGYDPDGNLTTTTSPNGTVVTSTFDGTDAMTGTRLTKGRSTLAGISYSRDSDNRVAIETDSGALGATTTPYTYDARDQLSVAGTSGYGYDLAGNLTSNAGTAETYNGADQVTATGTGATQTAFGYTPTGERTTTTPATGPTWAYAYDQAGRMTAATKTTPAVPKVTALTPNTAPPAGGATIVITGTGLTGAKAVTINNAPAATYTVDSDTQITATTPALPTGTGYVRVTTQAGTTATATPGKFIVKAPLPIVSQISPTSGPKTGGTSMVITGRGFSGAASVLVGTVTVGSFTVVSDTEIDLVTPASAPATRDVRVTTSDGRSAVTAVDAYTYTNTTTPVPVGTPGTPPPPSTPTPPTGTPTPAVTNQTTYAYDGDGLRTTENTATVSQHFVFDSTGQLPLVLDDGARSYLYGPTGLPFEQVDSTGTPLWYFTDQLGSARALSTTTGSVAGTWTFNPFGTVARHTGAVSTPLRYGRLYTDAATNLAVAVARTLDPVTAEFTSIDPLVSATAESYGYAREDPINTMDPSGKTPWTVCFWVCVGYDGSRGGLGIGGGSPSASLGSWTVGGRDFGASAIGYDNFDIVVGGGAAIGGGATYNVASGRWSQPVLCIGVVLGRCQAPGDPGASSPAFPKRTTPFIDDLTSGRLRDSRYGPLQSHSPSALLQSYTGASGVCGMRYQYA